MSHTKHTRVRILTLATSSLVVLLTSSVSLQNAPPRVEWGHRRAAELRSQLTARRGDRAPGSFALMTPAERRQAVDDVWGPGPSTEVKLQIFDTFWNYVDAKYAAFQGIDVDWAALRDKYRPEVAAGVSRGRLAAIINHMALALVESHTLPLDLDVNIFTLPTPGVPQLAIGAWTFDTPGACLTAQDDGSALVYSALPNHPLGLQRGDRILGYDGRPWPELFHQLRAEELPLWPLYWGSSPSSFEHSWVMAAGTNWHLFDTMDIAKSAGGVVHVPTSLMPGVLWYGWCSEQLAIPGVPKPADFYSEPVSFGIVSGTRIGYIYVWNWFYGNVAEDFANAVRQLTQVDRVEGLIVDFRYNAGGFLSASTEGLGALFPRHVPSVGIDERMNAADHFKMQRLWPPGWMRLDFNFVTGERVNESYEGPIAVLVGPGAVSSGDFGSYWASLHPTVRTFGKSTATAFNLPTQPALGTELFLHPDWDARIAEANFYPVASPNDYMTHREFPVDQPVWLRPADVAIGRDTVVEAALQWLHQQIGPP